MCAVFGNSFLECDRGLIGSSECVALVMDTIAMGSYS